MAGDHVLPMRPSAANTNAPPAAKAIRFRGIQFEVLGLMVPARSTGRSIGASSMQGACAMHC